LLALVGCAQSAPDSLGHPALDAGLQTYNRLCATCHGGDGQGNSAPSLDAVVSTFSDCATHQQWITLGSKNWQEQIGPTYGDNDKEITMVMPSFETALSAADIANVAAFERFQFGGATLEEALADCGL
jgi:mono/diheme cytochrome c family protein